MMIIELIIWFTFGVAVNAWVRSKPDIDTTGGDDHAHL